MLEQAAARRVIGACLLPLIMVWSPVGGLSPEDVQVYGEKLGKSMNAAVREAAWAITIDTSIVPAVVDTETQAQYCAYECLFTHFTNGCQAFDANYLGDSCTLMAANDLNSLVASTDINFYYLLPGDLTTDGSSLLAWRGNLVNGNTLLPDWNSTACSGSFSSWTGITCVHGRVTELVLENFGLQGLLDTAATSSLPLVGSLRVIDLSGNSLNGTLPDGWSSFGGALTFLDLSKNKHTGVMPPSWSNLQALGSLDLCHNQLRMPMSSALGRLQSLYRLTELRLCGGNQFTGTLPSQYAGPRMLKSLVVSGNGLTGTVPALAGLSRLEMLDLSGNSLTDLSALSYKENLTSLLASHNRLNGSSLAAVSGSLQANLPALTNLDLSHCRLGGVLPDGMSSFQNLERLILNNNAIMGGIPEAWDSALSRLVVLDLSHNNISGSYWMWGAPNKQMLEEINLAGNADFGPQASQLFAGLVSVGASVERLLLTSTAVWGPIPPSISALSMLKSLRLGFTDIDGGAGLPPVLTVLAGLETLELSGIGLGGRLPSVLRLFSGLKDLDLSSNSFSGMIPPEYTDLPLETLNLSDNMLTGTLPALLTNLDSIHTLNLANNQFHGAIHDSWAVALHGLSRLDLSGNQLSGVLPASWTSGGAYLQALQSIDLSDNYLTGALPDFSSLPSLRELRLGHNAYHGNLPAWLAAHQSLAVIDLQNNLLSGVLPGSFNSPGNLEVLDFSENALSGPIPASWTNCGNLRTLRLGGNQFTSSGFPAALVNTFQRMTTLDVSDIAFGGPLPVPSSPRQSLLSLDFANCSFTGTLGGAFIAGYPALQHLKLQDNALSGNLPPGLSLLPSLKDLDVSRNSFTGSSIPVSYPAALINLQAMRAAGCGLAGPVPTVWSSWRTSLQVLDLANNTMTGRLPSAWNSTCCFELQELDLGGNQLTGALQDSWAYNLPKLLEMSLSGNSITGTLPVSWASGFTSLAELDVGGNQITGAIPGAWSELAELQVLDVGSNNLTGTLPYCELASLTYLRKLIVSANLLTGFLPEATDWFYQSLEVWESSGNSFSGATQACNVTYSDSVYIVEFGLEFSTAALTNASDIGPPLLSALAAIAGQPIEYIRVESVSMAPNLKIIVIAIVPLTTFLEENNVNNTLISPLEARDWTTLGFPNWTAFGGPVMVSGYPFSYVDSGLPSSGHPNINARPLPPGYYDNFDWQTGLPAVPYRDSTYVITFAIGFEGAALADAPTLGPQFVAHMADNIFGVLHNYVVAESFFEETNTPPSFYVGLVLGIRVVVPLTSQIEEMETAQVATDLGYELWGSLGFPAAWDVYGRPYIHTAVVAQVYPGLPTNNPEPLANPGAARMYDNFDWSDSATTVTTGTRLVSATVRFPAATGSQVNSIMPPFLNAIVSFANLPHAGHVKLVSITGLAGGGLDVAFDAIFTNVTAPATRRRQLLHTAQDADNLAHALVDNIRSVFSSQVFGAFGVPQVPAGYSVRNTHYTTTTAYHEVYPADHYTSYDFMQPSIYSEEGSGSQFDSASSYYDSYDPYYGSDSLEPFSPETLIVSFLVHLPGFTSDDWWNIGPDFIQIVSRAIGGDPSLVKVRDFYEAKAGGTSVLMIDTSVILALDTPSAIDYYRSTFIDYLDPDGPRYPPALGRLGTLFGRYDVTGIWDREFYAGLPRDPYMPQIAVPHPPGYWSEYFMDTGSPDTGSPDAGSPDTGSPDAGSPDAGSPDTGSSMDEPRMPTLITYIVRFKVTFSNVATAALSTMARLYVSSVASAAGIQMERVKVSISKPGATSMLFDTTVVFPTVEQLRRRLQQDWNAAASNLVSGINRNIGAVFPPQAFGMYGAVTVTESARSDSYIGDLDSSLRPLPLGWYSNGFDWTALLDGSSTGSDYTSSSSDYYFSDFDSVFHPAETLVIKFAVAFRDLDHRDWPAVGPAVVEVLAGAIEQPQEYIKVIVDEGLRGPGLSLRATVIIPLYSPSDRREWMDGFVGNLGRMSAEPVLLLLGLEFGPYDVQVFPEAVYPGYPWDAGVPPDAKPLRPGYWQDYWGDIGGSDSVLDSWGSDSLYEYDSGSGSDSGGVSIVVVSFLSEFRDAGRGDLSMGLGLAYVSAIANAAGVIVERVKIKIYEMAGGGLEIETYVIYPLDSADRQGATRRILQVPGPATPRNLAAALIEKLRSSPSLIFSDRFFRAFAQPLISGVATWDHSGPIYDLLEPLKEGAYAKFPWTSPDVFVPADDSGSDSYESSGSYASDASSDLYEEFTFVLDFRVDFPNANREDVSDLGPMYVDAISSAAGVDVERVRILQLLVKQQGLGFVTQLSLPTYFEPVGRRQLLQEGLRWREVEGAFTTALEDDISSIFPARLIRIYGLPSLAGRVESRLIEGPLPKGLGPLPYGTYSPGMYDWEGLADGDTSGAPPPILDSDSEGYGDDGSYSEYTESDTTTVLIHFGIAFMTSSACDFLDNKKATQFLHWYRDAIIDFANSGGVLPAGQELGDFSVRVSLMMSEGLGQGGQRACDVPIVADTEIALPAFIPGGADEKRIRFAASELSTGFRTSLRAILKANLSCGIPNCGLTAFPITLPSTSDAVNMGGEDFDFGTPNLLEVAFDLDDVLGSGSREHGHDSSLGYYSDSLDDSGHGSGSFDGVEELMEYDQVNFAVKFPQLFDYFQFETAGFDTFLAHAEKAIASIAGVSPDFIASEGYVYQHNGGSGFEVSYSVYFRNEPPASIPTRGLLQVNSATAFLESASGGRLAEFLVQELKRMGVAVPGTVASGEPDRKVVFLSPNELPGAVSRPPGSGPGPGPRPGQIPDYEPYTYDYGSYHDSDDGSDHGSKGSGGIGRPGPPGQPGPPGRPGAGPGEPGGTGSLPYDSNEYDSAEEERVFATVELIPMTSFRMSFSDLTLDGLRSFPGAAAEFCGFYRNLISALAVVDPSDIQIRSIAPPAGSESSLEVFTRVRFDAIEALKYEDEDGIALPSRDDARFFYDPAASDVWDAIARMEAKLPIANLLRGTWTVSELSLGAIKMQNLRLPQGGYHVDPKLQGWWTSDEVDEAWSSEAPLCEVAGVEETPEPETPVATTDPISDLFKEPVAVDLGALLAAKGGNPGVDVNALLKREDPVFPSLEFPSAGTPAPVTLPDFLQNLNIWFDGVPTDPPTPPPTTKPAIKFDFTIEERIQAQEESPLGADTAPPVCELRPTSNGETNRVNLYMFGGRFVDPFVTCTDNGSELLDRASVDSSLYFRDYDGSWQPALTIETSLGVEVEYRITYQAFDSAGNRSPEIERFVVIKDPCKDRPDPTEICASQTQKTIRDGAPEIICSIPGMETKVCDRSLLSLVTDEGDADTRVQQAAVVDTEPPVVKLMLGDGQPYKRALSDGTEVEIVLHEYVVTRGKNTWVDPGWTASDDIDIVSKLKLSAEGAGAVTTAFPARQPYQIKYSAEDRAGNKSPLKIRVINVKCPAKEEICPEEFEDDGRGPRCSVAGQCGEGADALANLAELGLSTTGAGGTGSGISLAAGSVAVVRAAEISLDCGDSLVSVPVGKSYAACQKGVENCDPAVCDCGCSAFDGPNGDGDIRALVEACPSDKDGTTKRYFEKVGLRHCNIDTTLAGQYTIRFCVESSRGPSSRKCKDRLVAVQPDCGLESVCEDGVTCSLDGVCSDDLADSALFGVNLPAKDSRKEDTAPPVLRLNGGQFINLKRGTAYRKCDWANPDDQPTADDPCDLGVNATDHDSDYNLVDISKQVLACPPGSCLAQGTGCTGFEFFGVANGKPGEELQCNIINEMAAVGTVFELKFFVRDLTKPKEVQGATATRTITIVEPCGDGERFCEDDRTCSAIECAQRGQIIQESLEDKPPVVRLNGDAIVQVAYGERPSQNLLFCQTVEETDCGAYAVMEVNGVVTVPTDLSITSPSCRPDDAQAGTCLPGAYAFRYQAFDNQGRGSNIASRLFIVEQRAEVLMTVQLPLSVQDAVAAQAIAESYRENGFDNDLASLYLDAFIEAYGSTNANINRQTVSISDAFVTENQGALALSLVFSIQVSSTAISTGFEDVSTPVSTLTPTPTPDARRHLLQFHAQQGRHLLQEENLSAKLNGVLSGLSQGTSSFATAVATQAADGLVGAVPPVVYAVPSSRTTTPDVDIKGGLITALAAALDSYQERFLTLSFRLTSLLKGASRVSGEGSTQSADALESQIQRRYQALLEDFEGVTDFQAGNLTAILKLFDKALAEQLAINAGLSSTMEAIKESLANQAALLKTVVTTQDFIDFLYGPGWNGTGTPPPCPQAVARGEMAFYYDILHDEEDAGTGAGRQRRRLQQRGSGSAFSSADTDAQTIAQTDEYFGYRVSAFQEDSRAWDLSSSSVITRARYLGGPDRNRVLGGVLVHQQRASVNTSYCDSAGSSLLGGRLPGMKFTKLSSNCAHRSFLKSLNDPEYLRRWDKVMANPMHPFGSDPVWIRSSKMFDERMGGTESDYYNMTRGSEELNVMSGVMYTHFPREVPGKGDGFPLYVDSALDKIRLAEMLVYVEDSNYIDKRSESITIQLGVYNPEEKVFGYGKASVVRDVNGVWQQSFFFNGLPAITRDSSTAKGITMIIADNMVVVCAAAYLLWYIWAVFSNPNITVQAKSALKWSIDLAIVLAMCGTLYLHYSNLVQLLEFTARTSFEVYDAVAYAPARFLLPSKVNMSILNEDEVQVINSRLAVPDKAEAWASEPGLPGRWKLPDNNTGIQDYGEMMRQIDAIADRSAFYGALQGIIVLAMIFRMLHLWNFQGQVGIVTRTLFRVIPELGEFTLVLAILMVLYASYGMIVAGGNVSHYTTISDAFYSLFVIMVAADGGEMHGFAHAPGAEYMAVEVANIDFWYYSVWVFFFFILMTYLFGIVGNALAVEKEAALNSESVMEELEKITRPLVQTVRTGKMSNSKIVRKLEKLLDGIDNAIDFSDILRKHLKLKDDDDTMHLIPILGMKLDPQQLEQSLLVAHNRTLAKRQTLCDIKKIDLKAILCVVKRVVETQGVAYSVDMEFAEDLLRDKQRDVYADVLAVIEPAYNAAALLWEEQAAALAELQRISNALYLECRARGDTSMRAFTADNLEAPPTRTLSMLLPHVPYFSKDAEATIDFDYRGKEKLPSAVAINLEYNSLPSLSSESSLSSSSGHLKTVPIASQTRAEGGFLARVRKAFWGALWGLAGGSSRRVRQEVHGVYDKDAGRDQDRLLSPP